MKKWISVSAMAMVLAFATVALSAQAGGGKQAAPAKAEPKKEAPKKDEPKKDDAKKMAPCPAGEHLKDAKKAKDDKTNPCVKG